MNYVEIAREFKLEERTKSRMQGLHAATETGASFLLGSFGFARSKASSASRSLLATLERRTTASNRLSPPVGTDDAPAETSGRECFQVASRLGLLFGSSRKLALCGRSVHAAPLRPQGTGLPSAVSFSSNRRRSLECSFGIGLVEF